MPDVRAYRGKSSAEHNPASNVVLDFPHGVKRRTSGESFEGVTGKKPPRSNPVPSYAKCQLLGVVWLACA